MTYRAEVADKCQLKQALSRKELEYIYAPIDIIDESITDKDIIVAVPPLFLGDCEEKVKCRLKELKELGFSRALAHTAGHIPMIRDIGMKIHGGFRLNLTNSVSTGFYEEEGLEDITLSIELKIREGELIKSNIPMGIIGYGRLPLMALRRCPVSDGPVCGGRADCPKSIRDRKGNTFTLLCGENMTELLNPDTLVLSDKATDLNKFDFVTLKFTCETEIGRVLDLYLEGDSPEALFTKYTRGLYYRGVQ